MKLREAIRTLMYAAERDVRGTGLGIRETTDEWRDKVGAAWARAYCYVYGIEPNETAAFNAGIILPAKAERKDGEG